MSPSKPTVGSGAALSAALSAATEGASLQQSKLLLPNEFWMEMHSARIAPSAMNRTFVLTPSAATFLLKQAPPPAAPEKKAKKTAKTAPDGKTPLSPVPETELPETEPVPALIESLRYSPLFTTQTEVLTTIQEQGEEEGQVLKEWQELISGRKDGLACESCGVAWSIQESVGDLAKVLQEAKGGVTFLDLTDLGLTPITLPGLQEARTQKAKGISALRAGSASNVNVAVFHLAQDWAQLHFLWSFLNGQSGQEGKVFVRACPVRPRHGFVESRVVHTLKELREVHDETLEADPNGEWLLGEMIPATSNAVITPSSIAVGPGHDGATGGMNCLTLPLAKTVGLRMEDFPKESLALAAIAAPEVPYVETVTSGTKGNEKTFATQLRAGMEMPRMTDYLPETMTVRRVIRAEGSHLAWETLMQSLAGGLALQQGIVVDHTKGSMVSHYALHAVANGVPIVTSHVPMIDEVLAATVDAQESYNVQRFRDGVIDYYGIPERPIKTCLPTSVYAFHQAAFLRGEASYVLGWAIANIHHAGIMACAGETRHIYDRLTTYSGGIPAYVKSALPPGKARSEIFQRLLKDPKQVRTGILGTVTEAFRHCNWQGGYGGTLWNNCLDATLKLDDGLIKVMQGGSEADLTTVIGVTNNLLHLAHNNGWWLNKFINQDIMTLPYWTAKKGWLLPEMIKKVLPGLQEMLSAPKAPAVKEWSDLWASATPVSAAQRNVPPAWGHVPRDLMLLVPIAKAMPESLTVAQVLAATPVDVPAFLWIQWNFGSGLHLQIPLTHDGLAKLLSAAGTNLKSGVAGHNLPIPVWMAGEADGEEETSQRFVKLPISLGWQKVTGDLVVLTASGIALTGPMPLTGIDNDIHESLLAEALATCLTKL